MAKTKEQAQGYIARKSAGLPSHWKTIESYRKAINSLIERGSRGDKDLTPGKITALVTACRAGAELHLIASRQAADPDGLAELPDVPSDDETCESPGEVTDAEFEEIEMQERPDGTSVVVVLPTPGRKDE